MTRQLKTSDVVSRELMQSRVQNMLAACSPQGVDTYQVAAIVTDLVRKDEYLAKCEPMSIVGSVIEGTQLGLSFQRNLGHAYLVPRWDKKIGGNRATLQIGYKGLAKLARNSGEVSTIEAEVVRVGDEFEYEFGTNAYLKHRPAEHDERGEVTHIWCMVTMQNGQKIFDVMSIQDVQAIRNRNTNWQKTPWRTDPDEMGKKTVFRRMAKYLPLSIEAQAAINSEDDESTDYAEKYFPDRVKKEEPEEPINVECVKAESLDEVFEEEPTEEDKKDNIPADLFAGK